MCIATYYGWQCALVSLCIACRRIVYEIVSFKPYDTVDNVYMPCACVHVCRCLCIISLSYELLCFRNEISWSELLECFRRSTTFCASIDTNVVIGANCFRSFLMRSRIRSHHELNVNNEIVDIILQNSAIFSPFFFSIYQLQLVRSKFRLFVVVIRCLYLTSLSTVMLCVR